MRQTPRACRIWQARYNEAGRYSEASALLLKLIDADKVKCAADHPDVIADMRLLADSYKAAGRLAEAISLGEEVLKLSKRRFGTEHPETIINMNNLAITYSHARREKDAVSLLVAVLVLSRIKRGARTFRTRSKRSTISRSPIEIWANYRRPNHCSRSSYECTGRSKPPTIRCRSTRMVQLGRIYLGYARVTEGLALLEEACRLGKAKLDVAYSETCDALHYLGMEYHSRGQFDRAIPPLTNCAS